MQDVHVEYISAYSCRNSYIKRSANLTLGNYSKKMPAKLLLPKRTFPCALPLRSEGSFVSFPDSTQPEVQPALFTQQ